jgi:hypothetical protein
MKTAKQLAASWGRSFIAAALALYMAGVTDWKTLLNAGIAAVLPAAMRYFNPKDSLGQN